MPTLARPVGVVGDAPSGVSDALSILSGGKGMYCVSRLRRATCGHETLCPSCVSDILSILVWQQGNVLYELSHPSRDV